MKGNTLSHSPYTYKLTTETTTNEPSSVLDPFGSLETFSWENKAHVLGDDKMRELKPGGTHEWGNKMRELLEGKVRELLQDRTREEGNKVYKSSHYLPGKISFMPDLSPIGQV